MPFFIDDPIEIIKDTATSTTSTWSSSKIQAVDNASKIVFRGAYNASTVYAVNDLVSYAGSSWRRLIVGTTGTTPVEGATWTILAQKGDTGAAGESGLSSSIFDYRLDRNTFVINTGTADGHIRFNNESLIEATIMWIDHLDESNRDVERFLQTIPVGSRILIQDKSNSPNYVLYTVTSAITTVSESHVVVPIIWVQSSGTSALINNHQVLLGLQYIVQSSVAVGTTTTLSSGSSATVSNSGTSRDLVLDFGIPAGATGTAATIAVGTVSTGAPGTSASVSNSGTSAAAVLDFVIPRGDTGTSGAGTSSYYRWTRNTGSTANGWYSDSHLIIGWDNGSNEITMKLPTAKTGVYAIGLTNNNGSFPGGSSTMLLTTGSKDYYFLSGIGQIEFTVQADADTTYPFYKVRVVMTASGGSALLHATVEKFTL